MGSVYGELADKLGAIRTTVCPTEVISLLAWIEDRLDRIAEHPFAACILAGQRWLHPWLDSLLAAWVHKTGICARSAQLLQNYFGLADRKHTEKVRKVIANRIMCEQGIYASLMSGIASADRVITLSQDRNAFHHMLVGHGSRVIQLHEFGWRLAPRPSVEQLIYHASCNTSTDWPAFVAKFYRPKGECYHVNLFEVEPSTEWYIPIQDLIIPYCLYHRHYLADTVSGEKIPTGLQNAKLELTKEVLLRTPWVGSRLAQANKFGGKDMSKREIMDLFQLPKDPLRVLRWWLRERHYEDIVQLVDVWLNIARKIRGYEWLGTVPIERLLSRIPLTPGKQLFDMVRDLQELLPVRHFYRTSAGQITAAAWLCAQWADRGSYTESLPVDLRTLVCSYVCGFATTI